MRLTRGYKSQTDTDMICGFSRYLYPNNPPDDREVLKFCNKHKLVGFERMPTVNAISFTFQHPPTMECISDLIHMGMLETAVLEPPDNYTKEAKALMYGEHILLCVWAPMTIDEWRKKVGLASNSLSKLGRNRDQLGSAKSGRLLPAVKQDERLALPGDSVLEAVEETPGRVHGEPQVPGAGGSTSNIW